MGYEVIQPSTPYAGLNNQIQIAYGDDKEAYNKKHYVMWSGGTDSTLLLYELLKTYGADHVIAVSYRYPWLLQQKADNEKAHRLAFIAKAKLRDIGVFKHIEMHITQEDIMGKPAYLEANQGRGLPQALAWMLSVPILAEEGGYIYDGGIRNDDLTLRLESYHEMFRGMAGVMMRKLTLREPYLYLTKENVIEKLIDYDLYEETWFCETPEATKPCGRCVPCKTHAVALQYLSENGSTDYIKLQASRMLTRLRGIGDPVSLHDPKVSDIIVDSKQDIAHL